MTTIMAHEPSLISPPYIPRVLDLPALLARKSHFLFGPRQTGKSFLITHALPGVRVYDLLDSAVYLALSQNLARLAQELTPQDRIVVIDEVQRLPDLLNEVHRLIESRRVRFVLTGSSARKLRRRGVNLLAGRALTRFMHPLTATELGRDFDLKRALRYGTLPFACTEPDPRDYLKSYVTTYLREEVQQEGLARNLSAFARFLEAASFSQGAILNVAAVARDSAVHTKVAQDYFSIL